MAVDKDRTILRIRAMASSASTGSFKLMTQALLGVLLFIALACVYFMISFNLLSAELRRDLTPRLMRVNQAQQTAQVMVNSLAAELVEYSKKDAGIDPLLIKLNFKPAPTNAPAARR